MDESIAILLLPATVEELAIEPHVRSVLAIPRVLALEPGRARAPRFMRDATAARQASRISLPGTLRVVVLYHPDQYPLARALCAEHEQAELWYVPPDLTTTVAGKEITEAELAEFDQAARERAAGVLRTHEDNDVEDEPLYARFHELQVISQRAFVPGGEFRRRRSRKGWGRGG